MDKGGVLMEHRWYVCIDLKSFFASVECVERGLDPMNTKLVVADSSRSDKTICLAITPAMKALGIPNRCRVFQITCCSTAGYHPRGRTPDGPASPPR